MYHNKLNLSAQNFLYHSTLWVEGTRRQVTSNAVNVSREHGGLIRGVVGNMELKWVDVKEPEFDGIMRANVRVKVRMLKWILSKAVEE